MIKVKYVYVLADSALRGHLLLYFVVLLVCPGLAGGWLFVALG